MAYGILMKAQVRLHRTFLMLAIHLTTGIGQREVSLVDLPQQLHGLQAVQQPHLLLFHQPQQQLILAR